MNGVINQSNRRLKYFTGYHTEPTHNEHGEEDEGDIGVMHTHGI